MDLAPLTNSYYAQTPGTPARPSEQAVSAGPEGSVEPPGDEQVRGVNAAEEQATVDGDDEQSRPGDQELSEEEQREVEDLKARDREVRTHEQAHLAAAGQYASGGAGFDYTRGPDGRQYATGGEVGISTSVIEGDPEATLRKMEQVRRAALAPAEPSAQDLKVAAQATAAAAQARQDIAEEHRESSQDVLSDGAGAYDEISALETGEHGAIDLRA